jgi:hypothetical protein
MIGSSQVVIDVSVVSKYIWHSRFLKHIPSVSVFKSSLKHFGKPNVQWLFGNAQTWASGQTDTPSWECARSTFLCATAATSTHALRRRSWPALATPSSAPPLSSPPASLHCRHTHTHPLRHRCHAHSPSAPLPPPLRPLCAAAQLRIAGELYTGGLHAPTSLHLLKQQRDIALKAYVAIVRFKCFRCFRCTL